jgi:hypothetical protein
MENASSGLLLELLPDVATFRQHDGPEITARLTNNGERVVRLVMPGDGSLAGWRTPLIQWTFTPDPALIGLRLRGRIELHIQGIRQEDIFTLGPGQSRDLDHWILPRIFPSAPKFAASITYSNNPTIALRGFPSSYDDVAVAMVDESDQCSVHSNEIRVSFDESYPGEMRRAWFPELVELLRERWRNVSSCDELIALRADLQRQLHAIRVDRGIRDGARWILSNRSSDFRHRTWCEMPQISVRALILALGRFNIATAERVSDLDNQWRVFRLEHGLDLQGEGAN